MTTSYENQPAIAMSRVRHSESIAKLTAALSKAEAEFGEITKDSANPYYGSSYADLSALIKATRPALSKNELVIIQVPQMNGSVIVTTLLSHSSGEWLESDLNMNVSKPDAQGIGSAITYARRYAYQSILNIAGEEDDDGNAAVGKKQSERGAKASDEGDDLINPVQQRAWTSACSTGGRTENQKAQFLTALGLESIEQLSKADFNQAIRWALNKSPEVQEINEQMQKSVQLARRKKAQPAEADRADEIGAD